MKKEQIVYDDFAKVEMRLGKIVEVSDFPRARSPSYKVCVDFGSLGQRWSSAQITNYSADQLLGRQVVCVVNMPVRNIAGFQSEILMGGVPVPVHSDSVAEEMGYVLDHAGIRFAVCQQRATMIASEHALSATVADGCCYTALSLPTRFEVSNYAMG